ncbi:TlpA disulfide reductase family protein [Metasolibacillus sp.]|uniref:TlpA family protein disulfide reductase n=1 Tax=Metasolibacillus sp. TaxID=2703680 RepID=UPI0025D059BB|nr:TlpA disulfide reductase family protein [Metasolibacillus sp.]MCT6925435.1 TlpA family protein disulfide reductase [Metasolibacillus sp.]MCT6941538.1 TlpA family protein disulfide reductase [Metasolibacillus sp.]
MKNLLSGGVIFILVALIVVNYLAPDKKETVKEEANTKDVELSDRAVQNFELPNILGEKATLYDYLGKPVVLTFWATWCGPCNEEMPRLQKYYETKQDAHIVAVNATDMEASIAAVTKYAANKGWSLPILFDETGEIRKRFGGFTIPTTVFLSANGEIVHEVYGAIDEAYIDNILEQL